MRLCAGNTYKCVRTQMYNIHIELMKEKYSTWKMMASRMMRSRSWRKGKHNTQKPPDFSFNLLARLNSFECISSFAFQNDFALHFYLRYKYNSHSAWQLIDKWQRMKHTNNQLTTAHQKKHWTIYTNQSERAIWNRRQTKTTTAVFAHTPYGRAESTTNNSTKKKLRA